MSQLDGHTVSAGLMIRKWDLAQYSEEVYFISSSQSLVFRLGFLMSNEWSISVLGSPRPRPS